MTNAVIAGYVRSPFTPTRKEALAKVRPDDLAAQVVKGLLGRTGIDPGTIEDLIVGCAFPEGEQGRNIARLVIFLAGLPRSVGGVTVNRFCGSSMQSIHQAVGAIAMGAGDAFIGAGVESMTRVPIMGFNPLPNSALHEEMPEAYISMGDTAENVAAKYNIPRADQEAFAVASHKRRPPHRRPAGLTTRSSRSTPRTAPSPRMAASVAAPTPKILPIWNRPSARAAWSRLAPPPR